MKSIKVLGVHVNDYGGEREPLVFVHSFPLTSRMWNRQVEHFREKYRVITYDIRGLGRSRTDDNVYSMEKLVNDFFHIINHLKVQKVHAAGLSMGGYILLRAVLKDAERFHSLMLINTKADKDEDDVILKRSSQVIKIKSGGRDAYLQKLLPDLVTEGMENVRAEVEEIIKENTDEGICGNLLALSTRINTAKKISEVKVPLLMVAGMKDRINSPADMDLLYGMFKECRGKETLTAIVKIKNCGHLCNMESSYEFNRYIEWFLGECRD